MTNPPMTAEDIGLTIAFVVMVTMDLVGNSLVCLVVTLNKSMQTPMNYLLLNLALADMTVAIFVSPQFIFSRAFQHPEGITGRWLCKFVTGGNLLWTGACASAFFLVSIAFERYGAVMYPLTNKGKMTITRVKVTAAICWTAAIVWLLPLIITIDYDKQRNYCIWILPTEFLHKGYGVGCVIVVGAIPISIMSFLYSRVIYTLWFKTGTENIDPNQLAVVRLRQRVTKMMIIVTLIYTLCWLPNLVIQLLATLGPDAEFGSEGYRISVILVTLNSSVNPVVYTLQSETFRKNLRNLVCCTRMRARAIEPKPRAEGAHTNSTNVTYSTPASHDVTYSTPASHDVTYSTPASHDGQAESGL